MTFGTVVIHYYNDAAVEFGPPARVSSPAPPIRHVEARCVGLLALPLPPLGRACFAGSTRYWAPISSIFAPD
jgi:hypothetical protein